MSPHLLLCSMCCLLNHIVVRPQLHRHGKCWQSKSPLPFLRSQLGTQGGKDYSPVPRFLCFFSQPFMTFGGQVSAGLGLQAALLGPMQLAAESFSPCRDVCHAHTWGLGKFLQTPNGCRFTSPTTLLVPAHLSKQDGAREQVSESSTPPPYPHPSKTLYVPLLSPSSSRGCHYTSVALLHPQ